MTTPIEELKRLLSEESYAYLQEGVCEEDNETFEAADRVLLAITEARRKIGVRQWRRIRKMATVRRGPHPKLKKTWGAKKAIRKGAVNNRHR